MKKLPLALAFAAALIALGAAPAAAQESATFTADLSPLNSSDANGTATISVDGDQVTVSVETTGVSPNLPHAQHIHIGGQNECPPESAAGNMPPEDLIDTVEGKPFYGAIEVSLTTEGMVGPASALAVMRFPVADDSGDITYERTFDLPEGVTVDDLSRGVIVQHGISKLFADNGQYDGDPKSPLKASLPLEATIPALCGQLTSAQTGATPTGGVGTGAGGAQGGTPLLLALAAAFVAATAVMTLQVLRRSA